MGFYQVLFGLVKVDKPHLTQGNYIGHCFNIDIKNKLLVDINAWQFNEYLNNLKLPYILVTPLDNEFIKDRYLDGNKNPLSEVFN